MLSSRWKTTAAAKSWTGSRGFLLSEVSGFFTSRCISTVHPLAALSSTFDTVEPDHECDLPVSELMARRAGEKGAAVLPGTSFKWLIREKRRLVDVPEMRDSDGSGLNRSHCITTAARRV